MDRVLGGINRRQFTGFAGALGVAAACRAAGAAAARPQRYCGFIKYLRMLDYDELADGMAAAGFDGVEATVRSGDGYIRPEQAAVELPRFHAALRKRDLELSIVTTDILAADQPHAEDVLRTSAELGVERYRLGFFRYDLARPIFEQLDSWRRAFDGIAEMNRRLKIAAVYQNHSGATMLGATVWDLHRLIKDYPSEEIGCVWDQRHATVEAGEAWPLLYKLMKPHITAMSAKDFAWQGRKSVSVRLGEGQVDSQFYKAVAGSEFAGPISVHVEYLERSGGREQLAALKRDLVTLRAWMSQ